RLSALGVDALSASNDRLIAESRERSLRRPQSPSAPRDQGPGRHGWNPNNPGSAGYRACVPERDGSAGAPVVREWRLSVVVVEADDPARLVLAAEGRQVEVVIRIEEHIEPARIGRVCVEDRVALAEEDAEAGILASGGVWHAG